MTLRKAYRTFLRLNNLPDRNKKIDSRFTKFITDNFPYQIVHSFYHRNNEYSIYITEDDIKRIGYEIKLVTFPNPISGYDMVADTTTYSLKA